MARPGQAFEPRSPGRSHGREILNELGKLGARRVYGDGPDTSLPDDAAVRLNPLRRQR